MAKGKHAASATAKRLREAEDRIVELEATRDRERAEAHDREERLKAEVQNLKGRLLHDVGEAADERVRNVQEGYERRLSELTEQHRKSISEAFKYIQANGELRLEMADHVHVASIFGMKPGEWLQANGHGNRRRSRRAGRAYAMAVAEAERQAKS